MTVFSLFIQERRIKNPCRAEHPVPDRRHPLRIGNNAGEDKRNRDCEKDQRQVCEKKNDCKQDPARAFRCPGLKIIVHSKGF
jgi:hypothetical protein